MIRNLSFFFIFCFLIFFIGSCSTKSKSPVENDDPEIQRAAEIVIDKSVSIESDTFQKLKGASRTEPLKGRKVIKTVDIYYKKNESDMLPGEKLTLQEKMNILRESAELGEKEERLRKEQEALRLSNLRFDDQTESVIRIARKARSVGTAKNVELQEKEYRLINQLYENPEKLEEQKERIQKSYEKGGRKNDLDLASQFLTEVDEYDYSLSKAYGKFIRLSGEMEGDTREFVNDEGLKIIFHLPEDEIQISENEISFNLQVSQNIRDVYGIVLKDFTLVDKDNNPGKFTRIEPPRIIPIIAKKNEVFSLDLKFKIPEDDLPEKKLSFSFSFENYVYLFSYKVTEDSNLSSDVSQGEEEKPMIF